MTLEIGTDSPNPDPTHTTPGIEVTVEVIPTEVILDHSIDLHAIAPCITEVQACTATAVTCHTADPHHDNTSPERTVDPKHIGLAGNIINQHKACLLACKQCLGKTRTEGTNRSQLMILPHNTIAQVNRLVTQRMI